MHINSEIIIFAPLFFGSVLIMFLLVFKKKKRSAKSIYKLIDELEKKYIY